MEPSEDERAVVGKSLEVTSATSSARPSEMKTELCPLDLAGHCWYDLETRFCCGTRKAPPSHPVSSQRRTSWLPRYQDGTKQSLPHVLGGDSSEVAARERGVRAGSPTHRLCPPLSVLLLLPGQCVPARHRGHHSRVQAFLLRERG